MTEGRAMSDIVVPATPIEQVRRMVLEYLDVMQHQGTAGAYVRTIARHGRLLRIDVSDHPPVPPLEWDAELNDRLAAMAYQTNLAKEFLIASYVRAGLYHDEGGMINE